MRKNPLFTVMIVALSAIIALFALRAYRGGGSAEKPPAFAAGLTLASALEASRQDGKPVVAFVTADWCPPCQDMKRTTLLNPEVTRALSERAHAVYVDATSSLPSEVERFNIQGYPTLLLIRSGEEAGRLEGSAPADAVLALLSR